jgi:hypothetical protein
MDVLLKEIDRDQLPKEIGGTCTLHGEGPCITGGGIFPGAECALPRPSIT